jgi:hypothetical protein
MEEMIQMNKRFSIEQLEHMKTHDLADLLANVVLLLRRMPDVECGQLMTQIPEALNAQELPADASISSQTSEDTATVSTMTATDLGKKTVAELKKMATELHVSYDTKIKKADLISKILARQEHGHSEQYAIQNL